MTAHLSMQHSFKFVARAALTCLCTLVAALPVSAQAKDPFEGTWQLQVSKSTFSPGPPFMSSTETVQSVGNTRKTTVDVVLDKGQSVHYEFTAAYDGKDYPITGLLSADTVVLRRVNASTIERIHKKDGKTVATYVSKMSPDRRTVTTTQKGMNLRGEQINHTFVFERR